MKTLQALINLREEMTENIHPGPNTTSIAVLLSQTLDEYRNMRLGDLLFRHDFHMNLAKIDQFIGKERDYIVRQKD